MFNAAQVKALQQSSLLWLTNTPISAQNVDEVRQVLRFHEHRYYVESDPLLADAEYDIIFNKLKAFEAANPSLITPTSPTQRVGASLIKSFAKVQHLVPMLSLDNAYSADDLYDFDRKVKELTGLDDITYSVEPKFDGASISLIYENDKLVRAITRGDGEVGDDITTNVLQIRSVPAQATFSRYGIVQIEIRGEVMLNKVNFSKYNQSLIADGQPPLANPRNAAAGTIRMKDPVAVSKRNLEVFLYHVSFLVEGSGQLAVGSSQLGVGSSQLAVGGGQLVEGSSQLAVGSSQLAVRSSQLGVGSGQLVEGSLQLGVGSLQLAVGSGQLVEGSNINENTSAQIKKEAYPMALPTYHSGFIDMLWQLGFKTPKKEIGTMQGIQAVIEYVQQYEHTRDNLPYEIDGMVIKVDSIALQEKLGMTSHHPRWAIAFKFKARQATSKLLGIDFQVGRTGAITPVAKIEPAQVGGVTVSSISVHNADYIKEKDLKIGDAILIERSGDVIPQIVKSLVALRTGQEATIDFPTCCPVCSSILVRPSGEAVWRCVNVNCKAQVLERIMHFVSKDAMDIKSLGEANVRKFFELGMLKDVPGIYDITEAMFGNMEGFGAKSIQNLLIAIEASKQQPLHRLIYGLGIRYVGENTAKTLSRSISDIFDLATKSEDELKQMDDVGIKVANSIVAFFKNEDNILLLNQLKAKGVQTHSIKNDMPEGGLVGLSFLFTGTLNKLKRNEAEAMAEAKGGKILSGVSSKLNYLVVGTDAGSKLEKAKKLPTINIITEDEFITLINK